MYNNATYKIMNCELKKLIRYIESMSWILFVIFSWPLACQENKRIECAQIEDCDPNQRGNVHYGDPCEETWNCICDFICVEGLCVSSLNDPLINPPEGDEDEEEDIEERLYPRPEGTIIDYIGIAWVPIPAGEFMMGCAEGDRFCNTDELPSHEVPLEGFLMTETEITQQQYENIIKKATEGYYSGFLLPYFEGIPKENPSYFSNCPACPLDRFTLEEARNFCTLLDGNLPTEEQWEYAARANPLGSETVYGCGMESDCLDEIAWTNRNSEKRTHKVGQKLPNAFGLYDMIGNVWEWCDKDYKSEYDHPNDWIQYNSLDRGVLRGGSWQSGVYETRASYRYYAKYDDHRNFSVGFRCVKKQQ